MASDYWGYDAVLGVEFDDRAFHENVKTYIEKVKEDGSLFFIDVPNSTEMEIFFIVTTEQLPFTILDHGSITPESFEGEDSLLTKAELYDEWGDDDDDDDDDEDEDDEPAPVRADGTTVGWFGA